MINEDIVFITDTHIGSRGGSKIFRQLFRDYYEQELFPYLKQHQIKTVIHAGDFFDNRNSITLADIDYVMNEFIKLVEDYDIHMYIIAGNHDVAYKNTNVINSLSLLSRSPNITIVDKEIVTHKTSNKTFVMCPWINKENEKQLLEALKFYADDNNVLVGHLEVIGAKMYKHSIVNEHGLKPAELKSFHLVLSGHFHHPNTIGNIRYIGALFHYNWQDYGDWRGFLHYKSESDEYIEIENEFSLFTRLSYHAQDLANKTKQQIKELVEHQFVVIVIEDDYDRIELKEVIHKIESFGPLSLDIIDKTIIDDDNDNEADSIKLDDSKELIDYVNEYTNNDEPLSTLFVEIESEAQELQKDFS